jgi:protease-4
LLLELDLTEVPVAPDPGDLLGQFRARGHPQLRPTLRALHDSAADKRVTGLVVKVGGRLPWAAMQELRLGVEAFAASGKPTVAWAESFPEGDMSSYVLACTFGQVWLQPTGDLGMLGVGIETTFVRGALDRLGVQPELEQRYEYKNTADRLLRTELSEAHRQSLDRLAKSIYDDAVAAVAAGRGLSEERVRELADTGPRTANEAREVGLVDRVGYRDEVYATVRAQLGGDVQLLFADRWRPRRWPRPFRHRGSGHVALVEVRGVITAGRSRRGPFGRQCGSDTVTAALRAAVAQDKARAVVLRVDSPGGTVSASESIWREVSRVRAAGKPVVVSMGNVAASGGYYVSCPADVIVAMPATLTGSIGVIGGKIVMRQLLDRLGLTTGSVWHGARSLMFSARREFSTDERERLAATIDTVYDDFVAKVAAGLDLPVAEVEQVARGRVWTGRDALQVGLVHELGGLRDAVRIARERADLPEDAPVRPAVHVPLLRQLGRAKNSEDPRAAISAGWPSLSDFTTPAGLSGPVALLMPPIAVR